jgi:cephalosporin-C deacetylase
MPVTGLESFSPNIWTPSDFAEWWAVTVTELGGIDPSPRRSRGDEESGGGISQEQIEFTSLGDVRISGYLLRQERAQPCPLVVHAHGYNDRYDVMHAWAERGFHVLGFDARGFGRSPVPDVHESGVVLTGIHSRSESILRGAVADFLQAIATARELLDERIASTCLYGFSFGGALAVMAAALADGIDFLVAGQPTFGWNAERRRVSLAGSTREINDYIARFPWRTDAVMDTLSYFDTVSFAPRVRASAVIGIGLDDDVVPSRTVLAIVNQLRCPVEVRLFPVSHSQDPRESLWDNFHAEWLGYVAQGLPPDFGSPERQVRVVSP